MDAGNKELNIKAAAIARSNPGDWRRFLEAFEEFAEVQINKCIDAHADDVRLAQGRAQQCKQLVTLFKDAVKTADRIEGR